MIFASIIIIGIFFTLIQPIATIVLWGFIGSCVAALSISAIYIFVKAKRSQQ